MTSMNDKVLHPVYKTGLLILVVTGIGRKIKQNSMHPKIVLNNDPDTKFNILTTVTPWSG